MTELSDIAEKKNLRKQENQQVQFNDSTLILNKEQKSYTPKKSLKMTENVKKVENFQICGRISCLQL